MRRPRPCSPSSAKLEVLEGFDAAGKPEDAARASATSRCAICSPTPRASATTSGAPTSRATWRRPGRPRSSPAQNAALTTPLLFDPGERWDYGISIDWAGKMVEAVSGQKLGRYMKENIFDPLGMNGHRLQDHDEHAQAAGQDPQRGADGGCSPTRHSRSRRSRSSRWAAAGSTARPATISSSCA